MALHTSILVECPLPDGTSPGWFTTPDLNDAFEDYRLSSDGVLYRSISDVATLQADQGTEPRTMAELAHRLSRVQSTQKGEEPHDYSGFLTVKDGERRYALRLSKGTLEGIRPGGLEAWAQPGGDAGQALRELALAFSCGRVPAAQDIRRYIEIVLGPQA